MLHRQEFGQYCIQCKKNSFRFWGCRFTIKVQNISFDFYWILFYWWSFWVHFMFRLASHTLMLQGRRKMMLLYRRHLLHFISSEFVKAGVINHYYLRTTIFFVSIWSTIMYLKVHEIASQLEVESSVSNVEYRVPGYPGNWSLF